MTGLRAHPGEGSPSNITSIDGETAAKISNFQHAHYGAIGGKIAGLLGIKP